MLDELLINILSHAAMCAFLYVQYREQCTKKRMAGLIILLFLMICGAETIHISGVSKAYIVVFQILLTILMGITALKKFSILVMLNTFNAFTFVLPGNIIGKLMLIYIPDAVSPFLKILFAAMVCIAFHILVLLAANMYIGNWLHSLARDPDFPWTLMFLLPISYYITIFYVMNEPEMEAVTFRDLIIALMVTSLTVIAYGLAIQILKYQKKNSTLFYYNAEYELLIDQMNKRLDMTRESQGEMAVLRHDMRHMIRIVQRLISDGEHAAALAVLASYEDSVSSTAIRLYCKNVVINSVLEYTCSVCEDKKISFDVQADIPEALPASDTELAVVLSNLLENAIQAAEVCEDKKLIRFLAMQKDGKLIIEISNTFSGKLSYDYVTRMPVSKHGSGHGLGIQSVQIFAEKTGAVFDFGEENGLFVARLLLQN